MSKTKYREKFDYEDFDDEDRRQVKKQHQEHRRPVKNWKKAWTQHEDDFDDVDDFYTR